MTEIELFEAMRNRSIIIDSQYGRFCIKKIDKYGCASVNLGAEFSIGSDYARACKLAPTKKKYWLWAFKRGKQLLQNTTIYLDGDMKDSDGVECVAVAGAEFKQKIESSMIEVEV